MTVSADDYKVSKEAFVSNTSGSSITHINGISSAAIISLLLYYTYTHTRSPSPRPRHLNAASTPQRSPSLLSSWTLLVLPLLLSMTLFGENPALSLIYIIPCGVIGTLKARQESVESPLSPSRIGIGIGIGIRRTPTPQASRASSSSFDEQRPSSTPTSPAQDRGRDDEVSEMLRMKGDGDGNVNVKTGNGNDVGMSLTIQHLPALTVYRAHMLLMTFLAILAVDFPIFPRSLAKCESFGVSLMDLGVGSFVFSQGIISAIPLLANPIRLLTLTSPLPKILRTTRKVAPLFALGLIRLISVKGVDYPEHVSEYGKHWNFFFTMAMIPIFEVTLHPLLVHLPISFAAFLVTAAHQLVLSFSNLQDFTLNAPRTGLLSANKEGIVSLVGYLAIHLFGLSVGTMILPLSPSVFRKLQQRLSKHKTGQDTDMRLDDLEAKHADAMLELFSYASLWWILLGICYVLNLGGWVSRRLANFPYVIWIAAYNTTAMLVYILVFEFFVPRFSAHGLELTSQPRLRAISTNGSFYPRYSHTGPPRPRAPGLVLDSAREEAKAKTKIAPPLLEAINKNGLVLFLLANVATGLVNLSVSTMYASEVVSMVILGGYSFGLCAAAWVLRERRLVRF